MEFNPTRAIVHNEGCDLHYWHVGKGPRLVVFIPGGNGHGRQFNAMMNMLSSDLQHEFTSVTFDRRQMSASQLPAGEKNKRLSPPQQARDIRAIILALGFNTAAVLFGSSSGGIFALQFAHDFPEMIGRNGHVIAHEAPLISLLPDASEVFEWFLHLIDVHETLGLERVAAEFAERLIGYDDKGIPATVPPEAENRRNFWENEFPSLLGYTPNLWRIKANKTSVGVMRAVRCKEAFYARAAEEQAKILDCPIFVVPGHHGGFEVETDAFVPRFLEMLDLLERRREQALREAGPE